MRTWGIAGACIWAAGVLLSAAGQSTSTAQGVYTDAQATRGHATYERVCATCHQSDLRGNDDAEVPALVAEHFATQWRGEPVSALFRKISTTMPASAPGSLSAREVADVIAYLLQANQAPAGRSDLSADINALTGITIATESRTERGAP